MEFIEHHSEIPPSYSVEGPAHSLSAARSNWDVANVILKHLRLVVPDIVVKPGGPKPRALAFELLRTMRGFRMGTWCLRFRHGREDAEVGRRMERSPTSAWRHASVLESECSKGVGPRDPVSTSIKIDRELRHFDLFAGLVSA